MKIVCSNSKFSLSFLFGGNILYVVLVACSKDFSYLYLWTTNQIYSDILPRSNMMKRNAKSSDVLLDKSAPKSLMDPFGKKKPFIEKHFTVLDPYVRIERLDQETLRRLLSVRKVVGDESESSEESCEENECETSEESCEENECETSEESAEENETPVKQNRKKERQVNAKATSEMSEYEKQIQQNIEERRKMFQEIIGGAKKDLMKEVNKKKKKAGVNKKKKKEDVNEKKYRAQMYALKRKMEKSIEDPTLLTKNLRIRGRTLPIRNYSEHLVESSEESSEENSEASSEEYIKENRRPVNRKKKIQKTKKNKMEVKEVAESDTRKKYKRQDQSKTIDLVTLADTKLKLESIVDSKFNEEMIPLLEKEGELEELPVDKPDFLKLMKSFSIHEKGVAKISQSQIKCLAWHPSNYKLLVAVGDRRGNIGLWDIDKIDDKYQGVRALNTVHKLPINCITFDIFNPMRLLTSGDDHCFRSLDLHSNVCNKIYDSGFKDTLKITDHAQKNASTLIVSQRNVIVVDLRTEPCRAENTIQCFEKSTYTVSLHPQDENLFIACGRFGEMGIFDMRYTATGEVAVPVVTFPKATKRVNGAFFSPISGKYALTTCADNTLTIYDVQKGKSESECIKSIYHNNYIGRFLAPFKAVWHPQREDIFIVGSAEDPSRVELYGAPSGELLHTFEGEFLDSMTSITTFHPTVPIFATCNLTKVHIFRP